MPGEKISINCLVYKISLKKPVHIWGAGTSEFLLLLFFFAWTSKYQNICHSIFMSTNKLISCKLFQLYINPIKWWGVDLCLYVPKQNIETEPAMWILPFKRPGKQIESEFWFSNNICVCVYNLGGSPVTGQTGRPCRERVIQKILHVTAVFLDQMWIYNNLKGS